MTLTWKQFRLRQAILAAAIAVATFALLGTVSAVWPNPFFMRMTPTAGFEIVILSAQSVLVGLYVAIQAPACASRAARAGSVLGFLGVACPVCNKLLVLAFGQHCCCSISSLCGCTWACLALPSSRMRFGARPRERAVSLPAVWPEGWLLGVSSLSLV